LNDCPSRIAPPTKLRALEDDVAAHWDSYTGLYKGDEDEWEEPKARVFNLDCLSFDDQMDIEAKNVAATPGTPGTPGALFGKS